MATVDELMRTKDMVLRDGKVFVLRFTAAWCRPCRQIKPTYQGWVSQMGDAVVSIDVNIDESLDTYSFFKRKRIIRGVPAVLAWVPGDKDAECSYWPDDSVCTGSIPDLLLLFDRLSRAIAARAHETIEDV